MNSKSATATSFSSESHVAPTLVGASPRAGATLTLVLNFRTALCIVVVTAGCRGLTTGSDGNVASDGGAKGGAGSGGLAGGLNAPSANDASASVGATNNCIPTSDSCNGPAPQLNQLDPIQGCLGAPVALSDVCNTLVDSCNKNSGLSLDCALSPDGGVFVGVISDSYLLTGNGWYFVESPSVPIPGVVPSSEVATGAQYNQCTQAMCAPPCPGVTALPTMASCGEDAGPSAAAVAEPPSCQSGGPGLTTCGPGGTGTQSCCTSLEVPGGTFYRDYDGVTNTQMQSQATVNGLRIDRYEITVGRFRQFVSASVRGWVPAPGSGKHTHLNGGLGLVNLAKPRIPASTRTRRCARRLCFTHPAIRLNR